MFPLRPPPETTYLNDDYNWESRWYTGGYRNFKGVKSVDEYTLECSLDYNRTDKKVKVEMSVQGIDKQVHLKSDSVIGFYDVCQLVSRAESKIKKKAGLMPFPQWHHYLLLAIALFIAFFIGYAI